MSVICDTNLKFHSKNACVFFQGGQADVFCTITLKLLIRFYQRNSFRRSWGAGE